MFSKVLFRIYAVDALNSLLWKNCVSQCALCIVYYTIVHSSRCCEYTQYSSREELFCIAHSVHHMIVQLVLWMYSTVPLEKNVPYSVHSTVLYTVKGAVDVLNISLGKSCSLYSTLYSCTLLKVLWMFSIVSLGITVPYCVHNS